MPAPDLTDAYAKLDRARHHIADLNSEIIKFLATDFYRMRIEPDDGISGIRIFFDSLHEPDKKVDALIGDAIGNLRSTLDYAAVALAYPITGKTDGTGFPFANNADGFSGEVRSARCLGPCNPIIQNHFINEVQAYNGGNGHSFWVLNKLRNIDKHRLLIATVSIAGVIASFYNKSNNIRISDGHFNVRAGESSALIHMDVGMDMELTSEPRPTFEVRLSEPPYVEKTPVTPFLQSLARDVEGFLDALKVFL